MEKYDNDINHFTDFCKSLQEKPNNIVELAKYNELISDNVLYKNIGNNIGHHYWKLNNIVIWFSNNKVHSIIKIKNSA